MSDRDYAAKLAAWEHDASEFARVVAALDIGDTDTDVVQAIQSIVDDLDAVNDQVDQAQQVYAALGATDAATALERVQAMREALEELERDRRGYCAYCGASVGDHARSCKLAAALAPLPATEVEHDG